MFLLDRITSRMRDRPCSGPCGGAKALGLARIEPLPRVLKLLVHLLPGVGAEVTALDRSWRGRPRLVDESLDIRGFGIGRFGLADVAVFPGVRCARLAGTGGIADQQVESLGFELSNSQEQWLTAEGNQRSSGGSRGGAVRDDPTQRGIAEIDRAIRPRAHHGDRLFEAGGEIAK